MAYITQQDVENRFTPRHVRAWFTDDGSMTPNAAALTEALEEASKQGYAIMALAGWTEAQVQAMVNADPSVKGAFCDLFAGLGIRRRPEWWGDGPKPRWMIIEGSGVDKLEAIAQANRRPAAEQAPGAGPNPTYDTRVTAPAPQFIFAPQGGRNQGGGF